MDMNSLGAGMPPQVAQPAQMGPAGPAPTAPPRAAGPVDLMQQYQKLQQAGAMLGVARQGLDSLMELADTVTPQDVVTEAGKLVAAGLDPVQVAGLLADMPENGEMLVEWIAKHDQDIMARQAQLDAVMTEARHKLGVQAMHGLMAHHFENAEGGA